MEKKYITFKVSTVHDIRMPMEFYNSLTESQREDLVHTPRGFCQDNEDHAEYMGEGASESNYEYQNGEGHEYDYE